MSVSNKKIRKALYRLRVDGNTPIEVINYIEEKLIKNISNVKTTSKQVTPIISLLSDKFKDNSFNGIMNNVSLNEENGLLIKHSYKLLCDNFKNVTKNNFPMSCDETNRIIQLIKGGSKLQAVKSVKDFSNYGLAGSKYLVDELSRFIITEHY